jgi:hypothetical protein
MNKNQVQSIRQRNQFNTPNSVKKSTMSNEYFNKRFNSAHVNSNTFKSEPKKTTQIAQRRLFNTPKSTNIQTPSTRNIRMIGTAGFANSAAAAYKTPQSKFASNNILASSKSVKSITKSSRTVDRAKSSVRRSIQILNNANLAKEANVFFLISFLYLIFINSVTNIYFLRTYKRQHQIIEGSYSFSIRIIIKKVQ